MANLKKILKVPNAVLLYVRNIKGKLKNKKITALLFQA